MAKRRKPLDLSGCGEAWKGWHIGPYGRCRDWKLFAPDGQHFNPEEILTMIGTQLDLGHWQSRTREAEAKLAEARKPFDEFEVQVLAAAAMVLNRRVKGTPDLNLPVSGRRSLESFAKQLKYKEEP